MSNSGLASSARVERLLEKFETAVRVNEGMRLAKTDRIAMTISNESVEARRSTVLAEFGARQ